MGLLHRFFKQWQKKSDDCTKSDNLWSVVPNFINGERLTVESGELIPVYNPHTGMPERQIYASDREQIDMAVAAAMAAQINWQRTEPKERLQILLKFRELLSIAVDDLAKIICQEQGLPYDAALREVEQALLLLEDTPQWVRRLDGRFLSDSNKNNTILYKPEPVGIVCGIDCGQLAMKAPIWVIRNALMCGNSILFIPASTHPSIGVFLADLLQRSGLPSGVFNVLHGNHRTISLLLEHKNINATFLHGTPPQEAWEAISQSAVRCSLALTVDCRAIAVIMPDADLEDTVRILSRAFVSGCRNGQHLCAVIAVGNIALELSEALRLSFDELQSASDTPLPGAHLCEYTVEITNQMKEKLIQDGCSVVWRNDESLPESGWHTGMMVIDAVPADHEVLNQTKPLPILPIVRIPDETGIDEIIQQNGLFNTVGLFSGNVQKMYRYINKITSIRQIGINQLPRQPHAKVGLSGISDDDLLPFLTRTRTVIHHYGEIEKIIDSE